MDREFINELPRSVSGFMGLVALIGILLAAVFMVFVGLAVLAEWF